MRWIEALSYIPRVDTCTGSQNIINMGNWLHDDCMHIVTIELEFSFNSLFDCKIY